MHVDAERELCGVGCQPLFDLHIYCLLTPFRACTVALFCCTMPGGSMQPAPGCCLCAPTCLHGGTRHHALRLIACRIMRGASAPAKQTCWCCPYCPCNLQWHVCAVSHATMGSYAHAHTPCPLWTCAQLLMVCERRTTCLSHAQTAHAWCKCGWHVVTVCFARVWFTPTLPACFLVGSRAQLPHAPA